MTILLISITTALIFSGLCSLYEAVLLSLTPTQLGALATKHPRSAQLWSRYKAEIHRPIAVILIINTLAHTIGASVAGAQFEELFGQKWLAAFSIGLSFVILQFTEILPKTLGVRYNIQLAPTLGPTLATMVKIMAPVAALVRFLNRPFEGRTDAGKSAPTLEEISALAGLARVSDLIGAYQEKIIKRAAHMSGTPIREVMIPVEQITFLSTACSMTDAVMTAHEDPHTRFPICENNDRDKVLGYINFKEMVYRARTNPSDPSLRGIIRPVHYSEPDESVATLLRIFVEEHIHMSIVKSPDGKTLGLVTMEDLVEELVGELEDEFDRLPRMCHALSGGMWMVGGGLPVARLQEILGTQLTEPKGSTSAWLIRQMGRVPKRNEAYREGGFEFLIRRTRRGQIFEVAVSTQHDGASAST